MRVTIRPTAAPNREIDLTHALVSAVAGELWRQCGGNDVVNWMEAERFVESLVKPGEPRMAAEAKPAEVRPRHRPVREVVRPSRRVVDEDRVTGPLPVY